MEFLQLVAQIFGYILPVAGTLALIILIVVGIKVAKLIKKVENSLTNVDTVVSSANNAIGNLNKTIDMANKYVDDFGVTAKTVNNVSMSIEAVRYTLEQMIKKFIARWTKEYEQIKNLILSFLEKAENKTKEVVSNEEVNVSQTESEE
ncbi:MAG: hypothetical protein QM204_01465 [Bacillota bacterium]|jgi:uncharacterized protein YoxC|nr:hypothetical protein [Bacillota bacterium]NLL26619.1 hypothetical protein [Erysipelotrichia bacterium]